MVARAKTPKLYLFAALDLLCITVTPLDGHVRVGIGVDEHIECAWFSEFGQKRDGSSDLSEQCSDRSLDFFLS